MLIRLLISTAMAMCSGLDASAENVVYPPDSGVIDVTKPPYNAVPDDGKDEASAIQRALNSHVLGNHIFYFPNGVRHRRRAPESPQR